MTRRDARLNATSGSKAKSTAAIWAIRRFATGTASTGGPTAATVESNISAGRKRWAEFDDEPFGKIDALIASGDSLVDRVLDRVYAGCENLEIINWAIDWGLPTDRVVDILAQLDVNRARFEPVVR